jgi:predicted anti-sigma-YlaC factor YlaD
MLSGYLDLMLAQGDQQFIRLHLEECDRCRATVAEMSLIREAARATPFRRLADEQWNEAPRGTLSRWSRNLGWMVLAIWTAAVLVVVAVAPSVLEGPWASRALVWGPLGSLGALMVSAAIDRFYIAKRDIYRGVRK